MQRTHRPHSRRRRGSSVARVTGLFAATLLLGGCAWGPSQHPEITSTLEPVIDGRTEAFDAVFPGLPQPIELRWVEITLGDTDGRAPGPNDFAIHAVATLSLESMAQLEAQASDEGTWLTEPAAPEIVEALRMHVQTAFDTTGADMASFVAVPALADTIGVPTRTTEVYVAPGAGVLYLVSSTQ